MSTTRMLLERLVKASREFRPPWHNENHVVEFDKAIEAAEDHLREASRPNPRHFPNWSVSISESDGCVWLHLRSPEGQVAALRCQAKRGNGSYTLVAQAVRYFAQDFNVFFNKEHTQEDWRDIPCKIGPVKGFNDLSTASDRTKALRFLEGLAQGTEQYFFEDGFPRKNVIEKDARATQCLIEFQAERPRASTKDLSFEIERELVASHARLKKLVKDWADKEQK